MTTRIDARPGEEVGGVEVADVNPTTPAPEGDTAKKKGPPAKIDHPLLANGAKLSAIPEDYDPSVHSVLKEDNFEGGKLDVFYNYKADQYQAKADQWREKAKDFARLGGIADKKTAQKVLDTMASMRKQLEMLAAQGEDLRNFPEEMLKMCGFEINPPAA